MIHLCYPFVTDGMRDAVQETLKSRFIGQGPKVIELEQEFQKQLQSDTPVAVGSGTDALHLAYILAGVGPGDEVIAPVFTCTATNFPILWQGAKIVFADIQPNTLNIDPLDVAKKITKKTKVIVGVDYAGLPCDWEKLDSMGVITVDDAAHAPGAKGIGSSADFTTFSFQAIKHITTGDGGMLCIKEPAMVAKAKRLRWFGLDREKKLQDMKHWEGDITEVGYKYQMTDIAAAMGLESLKILGSQIAYRRTLVNLYREELWDMNEVTLLDDSMDSACWLMTVLVEDLSYYLDHDLTDAIFPDMMPHGRKFRLEHDKMSHEENLVPGCIESGMVMVRRQAFEAVGGWYEELWQEIGWKVFIYSLSEKKYRYHSTHKVPIIHINQASRDGLESENIDKYLEIMHNDHEKANEWEHYYRERHGLPCPPFCFCQRVPE